MRNLASIQVISALNPIPNADAIEVARVLGWNVVVKKGEFSVGDAVVYCEIDSLLPIRPEFEFLRKSCYREAFEEEGSVLLREGFRIKTVRLRGQVSQGICFPLTLLPEGSPTEVGADVTEILDIIQYDPPLPACLRGKAKGYFPSFISKTGETRVQTLEHVLARHAGKEFYLTEKLEGESSTLFKTQDDFGICGHTLWWDDQDEDLLLGRFVKERGLKERLPKGYALQGELIGPGIRKNLYALDKVSLKVFNVLRIHEGYSTLLPFDEAAAFVQNLGLETVPFVGKVTLDHSVDDLVELSRGKSLLNPKLHREGLVFRPVVEEFDLSLGRLSFKVINPDFLLKHED